MQDSYDEIIKVLDLMNLSNSFVVKGAPLARKSEDDLHESDGARLIVEEALKDDSPLYLVFMGAITDMASAILMEPKILSKNIKVIWIGGGAYPDGGYEYNLSNDIIAANVVFKSGIEIWQIPRNVYRMMPVSIAELFNRVYPCGQIGRYLTNNVVEFNNASNARPKEFRVLGDSPAIGVLLYENCGLWHDEKRPTFNMDMSYSFDGDYGRIRLYDTIDSRFILEDLYGKLKVYKNGKRPYLGLLSFYA